MLRIFWNSRSAMSANQQKLDTISNNLANANTDGYKKADVSFKDLVYETLNRKGYPISENQDREQDPFTGTGVRTSGLVRDNSQGNLYETSKKTDFAIDGEGYYKVTQSNGQAAYTRSGNFALDANGTLVDLNGNKLTVNYNEGYNEQNVQLTENNFTVTKEGIITVKNGNTDIEVGKIPLFNAIGTDSFKSIGENLYTPVDGAEIYNVEGSDLLQGYIEGSNVDITTEMTDMIMTQRAFELGSKGIKVADEMWGMANSLTK